MSGIAGIYRLDSQPVDPALLQRLLAAMAHRGPDGSGVWLDGPVGLGHVMLRTTPESLLERQPLTNDAGTLCLALDGRVDNRDEVRRALAARGVALRADTDAELVLQAYECWGEACPERIIGDFAFVIWDGRQRQLVCARDPLGTKPFYYYTNGRTFLWASEPRPLFEDATVACQPNEGMIAEFLANAITDVEETLYRGILRLPPAFILRVRPDGIRKARYWDIDPSREIRYRSDAAYAEHFAAVFREAVRCRVRSQGPVGALLSGGLDSSSVVGVAQSLYRAGVVPDPGFETFSLVFPGMACDEREYIEAVVGMWGLKSTALSVEPLLADGAGALSSVEQAGRYRDVPDYPSGSMYGPLMVLARDKGFRVLLTGIGGDEWLTGSDLHCADLLRQRRLGGLLRQSRMDANGSGPIGLLWHVARFGLWPLLPPAAQHGVRWALGRRPPPPWIDTAFARRTQIAQRVRARAVGPRLRTLAQREMYETLAGGLRIHLAEMMDRLVSRWGLEERHPFDDRRVVEFALALPEPQRRRGTQRKFILRQAMRDLLPERVRQRATKAILEQVPERTWEAHGGERFFDALRIASLGWVNGAEVGRMYRQMARQHTSEGDDGPCYLWPLQMIFSIELWVRAGGFNGPAVAGPRGARSLGLLNGGETHGATAR